MAAIVLLWACLAAAQVKPTLGVLEVRLSHGDPQARELATSLVRGRVLELVQDTVDVVEGAVLERMITANAQACAQAECLAQFARKVGVDYLLETRIWQAEGRWNAIVKLASAENTSLLAEKVGEYPDEPRLRRGLPELAEAAVRPLVWPALSGLGEVSSPEEELEGGSGRRVPVTLASEPSGASVRIDGRPLGTTPCRIRLVTGEHRLELERSGYEPQRRLLAVGEEGLSLRVELSPVRGSLFVLARDSVTGGLVQAEVVAEGIPVGTAPLEARIPLRAREILLRAPGYLPATVPIRLEGTVVESLQVRLRSVPRPSGQEGMARIAGGCFWMGSTTTDLARGEDERAHRVCLDPFWLDRTEVTQEAWFAVMGTRPSRFRDCGPDCPVEQVDWSQADDYCRRQGKRLPTEAQWEFAARSGKGWPGGDTSERYGTHPVQEDPADAWGIRGLQGNVLEWVADWYGTYPSGLARNPAGPASGRFRVFRGAGWNMPSGRRRSASRFFHEPSLRLSTLGFRCAAP